MNKIVIPNFGNYYVAFKIIIEKLINKEIMPYKKMSKDILKKGARYSPDFICAPFKYQLGMFIEALENGANAILQVGGGCKFGYYAELQEKILRDIGYDFEFYRLYDRKQGDKTNSIIFIYRNLKNINPKLNVFKFVYYGLFTVLMIMFIDHFEKYIRKNECYQINNNIEIIRDRMFKDLDKCSRYYKLFFYFFKYKWLFLRCKKKKVKKKYKIGIIGELYTLMDSDANNNIEKYLKDYGVEITRFMNFSNLIFFNKCDGKKSLGHKNKYLKYHLGATATYTIKNALYFAKHHYDGILHLKSSFCTPEISAMAILNRISNDYDIPIAYFSFDTENSDEAMKTRLEAFLDMIKMRRDRNE